MPRRLGQHFLAAAAWRTRILEGVAPQAGDVWVEIGAGHGEMTRELARRARRVVAVELDPRLVERLRELAAGLPNVAIVAGDVLRVDLARLAGGGRFKVYGNIPYYITSPILQRLFRFSEQIDAIFLVIQLEVAVRLVARPGRRQYGYLSVLAQFYAEPEILLRIPPGAFRPPPKVTSALVRLVPHAAATRCERLAMGTEEAFLEFIGSCFHQKRKTLRNNLRALVGTERAEALLREAGLRPQARAEELNLAQFAALFRALRMPA